MVHRGCHLSKVLVFPQTALAPSVCMLVIILLLYLHFLSDSVILSIVLSLPVFFSILTVPWRQVESVYGSAG